MTAHPAQLILTMVLGLAVVVVIAAALGLIYAALRPRRTVVAVESRTGQLPPRPRLDAAPPAAARQWPMLAAGLLMLGWAFAGKHAVQFMYRGADSTPTSMLPTTRKIRGPDGAEIAISESGSAAGPTLVLTHGWGADRNDWAYLVATLGSRFRVVSWDLPGLGESEPTRDLDYALPTLAKSLDRVVAASQERGPITLVGHSIGGMLNIEYARQYPAKLGPVVGRIVQVNTTYTNPLETKKGAERSRKLQEPVFEPLLGVLAHTSPLARGLGWLAYRSGLAHLQLASQSFAGSQSWAQLDHMASYAYRSSPGIVARGVLGMLAWDGTDALPRLHVPTLILTGVEDVTTLPSASERMQHDIPGSKLVAIERAAHLGPVERHDAYASAISDFVAAPRPPAPAN